MITQMKKVGFLKKHNNTTTKIPIVEIFKKGGGHIDCIYLISDFFTHKQKRSEKIQTKY